MTAVSIKREEPGLGTIESFPIATDEPLLHGLLREIFADHWQEIVFGTHVLGSVFEICAPNAPTRISLHDGYLTVDFGRWHFHVCIGDHRGKGAPVPPTPEVNLHRRTGRAEFYRMLNRDGAAYSWGLRLYNGGGEQQITVFFPNPFATPENTRARQPDWSRLAMWDDFRRRYLGLEPEDCDRAARKPK
ncbi:DUF7676 family protein [Insolitispirillum peregrinum]|uniref:Uncharacterized protein n=1 Tax=Insolitispirillum peregrinum TaxID=80876 RepID=A0A1N7MYE5_9PROT|nr:hypothetical protein [Insolitispirillum peregrinum]SIS91048.1 hypothetical protein SAMN05421779_104430 [Insolitispirillum peregrinum]